MNTIKSLKIEIATLFLLTLGMFSYMPFNMKIKAVGTSIKESANISNFSILEYIESTGSEYIDTGVKANNNTHVILEAQWLIGTGNLSLFGSRNSSSTGAFMLSARSSGTNAIFMSYGNSTSFQVSNSNFSPNDLTSKFTLDANKNVWTLSNDSKTYTKTFSENTFNGNYNLLISGITSGSNSVTNISKMRIYSCKIYDNNTLIRDFVPVKSAANVPGLYDLVNNEFYYNSDVFVAGPVTEVYYTVNLSSNSGGTVSGNGSYLQGTSVSITATPNSGYTFTGWYDINNNLVYSNPTTVINITHDITLNAIFTPNSIDPDNPDNPDEPVNPDDPDNPDIPVEFNTIIGVNRYCYDYEYSQVPISYNFLGNAHYYESTQSISYSGVTLDPLSNIETKITVVVGYDIIFNGSYYGSLEYNVGEAWSTVYFNGDHVTVNRIYSNANSYSNCQIRNVVAYKNSTIADTNNFIVNGDSTSESSVENADENNNNLNESINNFEDIESSYNDDMNENLENIDTNYSDPNNWDSSFLSSASWVKDQFDNLTEDTPFGQVITFASTIGLGLLVIGRLVH